MLPFFSRLDHPAARQHADSLRVGLTVTLLCQSRQQLWKLISFASRGGFTYRREIFLPFFREVIYS